MSDDNLHLENGKNYLQHGYQPNITNPDERPFGEGYMPPGIPADSAPTITPTTGSGQQAPTNTSGE